MARGAFGPGIRLAGISGRGVTIALLDTGVDLRKPYLHGHVLDGIDVVGDSVNARARAKPTDPAQLERHGTEMAGLIVGSGPVTGGRARRDHPSDPRRRLAGRPAGTTPSTRAPGAARGPRARGRPERGRRCP